MKRLFWVFVGLTLFQCDLFNQQDKKEDEGVVYDPPYFLSANKHFPFKTPRYIWISKENEIFVGGKYSWASSNNFGTSFSRYSTPDSTLSWNVKKFDDHFYGYGTVPSDYSVIAGDTTLGSLISTFEQIYKSEDGNVWSLVTGPFEMFDFTVKDEVIYVATDGGVVVHDLQNSQEYFDEFLQTKSLDYINQVVINDNDELFVASHDGVYRSNDFGRTWTKVTEEISKDEDYVSKIWLIGDNELYAFGTKLLHSTDGGESWVKVGLQYEDDSGNLKSFSSSDLEISSNEMFYSISFRGFYVADLSNSSIVEYSGPHSSSVESSNRYDYEEIHYFNNGRVLISNWENISFKIATKNFSSSFWD